MDILCQLRMKSLAASTLNDMKFSTYLSSAIMLWTMLWIPTWSLRFHSQWRYTDGHLAWEYYGGT